MKNDPHIYKNARHLRQQETGTTQTRSHMSEEIVPQVFENSEFGAIRAMHDEDGEPCFVASDIAKALGYRDAEKMTRRLDDDEKGTRSVGTPGGEQQMTVITEAGMYSAILGSKVEGAKRFKRWVTHEVLPALRRDGGYMVARDNETPQETMARALLIAQETIDRKDSTIAAQQDTIRELAPKAAFYDAVGDSDGKMSVADFSKALRQAGIHMGQNRLFTWFRENGYMGKRGVNLQTHHAAAAVETSHLEQASPRRGQVGEGETWRTAYRCAAFHPF